MPYIDKEKGIYAEDVKCNCCGWEGTEYDLKIDSHESHTSSMPLGSNCPKCDNYIE